MYFYYFTIISPLRRAWSFIWTNLNLFTRGYTLYQVCLKLAQLFWRRFLKVVNSFLLFPNYLPFGKDMALQLNKLESPSPRNTLCQVWLKMAQCMVLEKIFKSCQILSPLGRAWPFIWINFIPFTQGYFVPSLVEIGPVVLEKKMKMKVYRRTDRRTTGDQKSSLELPVQVS